MGGAYDCSCAQFNHRQRGRRQESYSYREGGEGGTEIFKFTVIDQNASTTVELGPAEEKDVSVTHTAGGDGLVFVTNQASGLTLHYWLDVDAASSGR
jgi:hypothetical protein